jgi:signal transduction histidine kinase
VLPELAQLGAGWPLAASLAAAATARGLAAGRRRTALNEALHELRRPLQALSLATPGRPAEGAGLDWSVQMAAAALERLDREINGEAAVATRSPLPAKPLLESAQARWRGRAALAGGSLRLRWQAEEATICADRCEIGQALDNLIVNAIEHGGPAILVEGRRREGRLRIVVADSGFAAPRPGPPGQAVDSGRGRSWAGRAARGSRGHGLSVVRRVAAEHRGRFVLRRSPSGSMAVLELPLPCEPAAHA